MKYKELQFLNQCARKARAPRSLAIAQCTVAVAAPEAAASAGRGGRAHRSHRSDLERRSWLGFPARRARAIPARGRERHGATSPLHVTPWAGACSSGVLESAAALHRQALAHKHAGETGNAGIGQPQRSWWNSIVIDALKSSKYKRDHHRRPMPCKAHTRCFREKISVDHSPPWLPPPERRWQEQTHLTRMN